MEDAVDSVASKALGKGLEICSYLDPTIQTVVFGDPDRLRQILLNLLSNGIKFTNTGQVYVVVEPEEQTLTHATFRFKVYDSGIGITEEGQKKLFNRFSQVGPSVIDKSSCINYDSSTIVTFCRWTPPRPAPTGALVLALRFPNSLPSL